jgi:hypothetical protein
MTDGLGEIQWQMVRERKSLLSSESRMFINLKFSLRQEHLRTNAKNDAELLINL